MPNPEPLPTATVAEELGCDVRTVHRKVAAGEITPLYKAPGLRGPYLFAPDEVQRVKALLAERAAS
ncbi:MAG TPA: hypothetical protein VFH56_13930 [Acidimicrobiales bacterium]|nr:hypothetical protein [Acidimicrobiales bacterium]